MTHQQIVKDALNKYAYDLRPFAGLEAVAYVLTYIDEGKDHYEI